MIGNNYFIFLKKAYLVVSLKNDCADTCQIFDCTIEIVYFFC